MLEIGEVVEGEPAVVDGFVVVGTLLAVDIGDSVVAATVARLDGVNVENEADAVVERLCVVAGSVCIVDGKTG